MAGPSSLRAEKGLQGGEEHQPEVPPISSGLEVPLSCFPGPGRGYSEQGEVR